MKETGQCPNLPDSAFILYHHNTNIYGGSALETLPEEEGDNDSSGEEAASSCASSCSSDLHWENNGVEPGPRVLGSNTTKNSKIKGACDISQQSPTIRHEIETQRAKALILEARIRELQDELKESKDQNELLEFRLLELGEFESSSSGAHAQIDALNCNEDGKRCKRRRSKSQDRSDIVNECSGVEALVLGSGASQVRLYETDDGAEEVTSTEENSSNSHSSVAEARSSCSDCSESLSFQESGIFENQFTEDSYSSHSGRTTQEDLNGEFARLVSHIETLVHGFRAEEGQESKGSKDGAEVKGIESRLQSRNGGKGCYMRSKNDLSYEFLAFRSRIQDFERKLRKFGNAQYITSLEDKISLLLLESQKLEEEKAEMEEADNDSRNQFQRLTEKVNELKEKKGILQQQLTNERRFIEQLRVQLLQFKETEEDLRCQVLRFESTAQNHEQRNFELEESLIELKDSIQFLIFSIPLLLLWVLRSFRSPHQKPPLALLHPHQGAITNSKTEGREIENLVRKAEIGIQTTLEHELWPDLNLGSGKRNYRDNWSPAGKEISRELNELEKKGILGLKEEEENPLESCRKKLKALQEKWDALIKELEEFEVVSKKNPNEVNNSRSLGQTTKIRQGSLVATRIRSLFPKERHSSQIDQLHPAQTRLPGYQTSYLSRIQQKMSEQFLKYELKQKDLLDEIDRLKRVLSGENNNTEIFENQKKEICFLREENNRLSRLLGEQESLWSRLQELEEESGRLRAELMMTGDMERKIDEAQRYAKIMMNRVEELEQNEGVWRETLTEREKKEKKAGESLALLRNEIQIMRNKCCVMEDELDLRVKEVKTYKQEIHALNSKLKESFSIIQDKESLLTGLEESFRSQITKLETQVEEIQQEVGDLECTNGMLREEVLYFEKTLAEVTDKKDCNEKMVQILSEKLQTKEDSILELKKQILEYNRTRRINSPNDLDVFARSDGGLTGVAREMKEIMALVNNCIVCKLTTSEKFIEITNQINSLSQMLEGSHQTPCVDGTEGQLPTLISLSRCESEEHLSSSPLGFSPVGSVGWPCRCQVEENKVLKSNLTLLETKLLQKEKEIRDLSERQGILSSQLKGLEDISVRREKELRESHLNESWWWKLRCEEKNELIQILARRIAHLSATDIHGSCLLEGILREIHIVHKSYPNLCLPTTKHEEDLPLDSTSLLNYFNTERRRIMDILESSCNTLENHSDPSLSPGLDFRVLRRIGEDSLLVSWCANHSGQSDSFDGYEISVNGDTYLKVPNPNRCKAFLFGLNMSEPLQLKLKLKSLGSSSFSQQECSITYIA